jgi:hypothetical protein
LEAEREKKEKAEVLRLMKEEEESIKATERELARKRKALHDAQKAAQRPVDNIVNEDKDVVSVSTVGEPVSNILNVRIYSLLTIYTDYIRGLRRHSPNGKPRKKVARKWSKLSTQL